MKNILGFVSPIVSEPFNPILFAITYNINSGTGYVLIFTKKKGKIFGQRAMACLQSFQTALENKDYDRVDSAIITAHSKHSPIFFYTNQEK